MKVLTKIWLIVACTHMLAFTVAVLVYLANQWLTVGYGINPWIALPVATLLMAIPYLMINWAADTSAQDADSNADEYYALQQHLNRGNSNYSGSTRW